MGQAVCAPLSFGFIGLPTVEGPALVPLLVQTVWNYSVKHPEWQIRGAESWK
jgi:hypothetical protein